MLLGEVWYFPVLFNADLLFFQIQALSMLSTSSARRAMKRVPTFCAGAALTSSTLSLQWSAQR